MYEAKIRDWLKSDFRKALRAKVDGGVVWLSYVSKPGTEGLNCHNFALSGFQGNDALYRGDLLTAYAKKEFVRGGAIEVALYDPKLAGKTVTEQKVRKYWIGKTRTGVPDHSARQELSNGLFWHRLMNADSAVIGIPAGVTAAELGYGCEEEVKVKTVSDGLDRQAQLLVFSK